MAILDEAAQLVKERLGDAFHDFTIERSVIGTLYLGHMSRRAEKRVLLEMFRDAMQYIFGFCLGLLKKVLQRSYCPQHFLNFKLLPHGQGWLRPGRALLMRRSAFDLSSR